MNPLLVTAAIVGAGLGLVALSKPKGPEVVPWPTPVPIPPVTPANPADLVNQLTLILTNQSTLLANPSEADAVRLDGLALQLEAANLPIQALQARALASQIRAKLSSVPPPPTPPPAPLPVDVLMASYNAMIAQAVANPQLANADTMDYVAGQLQTAGRTTEATALRAAANQVRVAQGKPTKP